MYLAVSSTSPLSLQDLLDYEVDSDEEWEEEEPGESLSHSEGVSFIRGFNYRPHFCNIYFDVPTTFLV